MRVGTIRGRLLLENGYHSGWGFYSNKYGIYSTNNCTYWATEATPIGLFMGVQHSCPNLMARHVHACMDPRWVHVSTTTHRQKLMIMLGCLWDGTVAEFNTCS